MITLDTPGGVGRMCTSVGAEGGQLEEVVAQEIKHSNSKGLSNYQHH